MSGDRTARFAPLGAEVGLVRAPREDGAGRPGQELEGAVRTVRGVIDDERIGIAALEQGTEWVYRVLVEVAGHG